ncbi:hypothetical protein HanRHA438_Chr04g0169591 [Helianthus annuus]|uniref:Uncharacterized protein n=1 Tax=Helianthus annuus TaxID=4232 RepID=A0A251UZL1_HELAN|nr:hypothetical protein HanXRQr2_Chr04g0159391 [Helianthus annuus]KAJ0580601.1 hypothetical protein HanHA300_Chr04g0131131 [Helianthus annuus]KAJ0588221.1 hypothetical protein HanIR_Chr04g0172081 [Helianthus annuus]KAJ0757218.1 hypothetical protein HanLR1_Chr04g0136091 [Helianthus annuus]KAJ0760941.1 hypothetical protein HanOQP8_Chr04g0143851 [Helianthus annuus]
MEDKVLRPGNILTIWLSCKASLKGLHTTCVEFTLDDEIIRQFGFVTAEDQFSWSLIYRHNRPRTLIPRPVRSFPIVTYSGFSEAFIGVHGVDEKEGYGVSSWFNRIEASVVVEVVVFLRS